MPDWNWGTAPAPWPPWRSGLRRKAPPPSMRPPAGPPPTRSGPWPSRPPSAPWRACPRATSARWRICGSPGPSSIPIRRTPWRCARPAPGSSPRIPLPWRTGCGPWRRRIDWTKPIRPWPPPRPWGPSGACCCARISRRITATMRRPTGSWMPPWISPGPSPCARPTPSAWTRPCPARRAPGAPPWTAPSMVPPSCAWPPTSRATSGAPPLESCFGRSSAASRPSWAAPTIC